MYYVWFAGMVRDLAEPEELPVFSGGADENYNGNLI